MTNNEAMMARIRALLAKAESTTPEEAELPTREEAELDMCRHRAALRSLNRGSQR